MRSSGNEHEIYDPDQLVNEVLRNNWIKFKECFKSILSSGVIKTNDSLT